jgi:hypothetical protein
VKLAITVDDRTRTLDVSEQFVREAEGFFRKMDRDMDAGWQIGPEWIERPDTTQRCQIAADRLLGSLSVASETTAALMAGYIVARLPGVTEVLIDTHGEPLHTEFRFDRHAAAAPGARAVGTPAHKLTRAEALAQAGKDVTKVYAVGRSFRYAVFDDARARWAESPLYESEKEAQEQRMRAFKQRYDELCG